MAARRCRPANAISRKIAGYLCEQRKNSFSGATADAPSFRPGRENTSGHELPVFFLKINTLLFSEALVCGAPHRQTARQRSHARAKPAASPVLVRVCPAGRWQDSLVFPGSGRIT
jgi:hypothetical protein